MAKEDDEREVGDSDEHALRDGDVVEGLVVLFAQNREVYLNRGQQDDQQHQRVGLRHDFVYQDAAAEEPHPLRDRRGDAAAVQHADRQQVEQVDQKTTFGDGQIERL